MKSIISTGLGPLHLVTAAVAIQQAGVDVELIQGFLPNKLPPLLVNVFGRLLGKPDLYRRLQKRIPAALSPEQLHGCAFPDFYGQLMFRIAGLNEQKHNRVAGRSWQMFGRSSRKYLHDAQIFHVRSGAGQGGAIAMAGKRGMKVVVDHSIAHPALIHELLSDLSRRYQLPMTITPRDPFWKGCVLADCEMADRIMVNSEFVRKSFIAVGFPEEKISTVYLGVRDDFNALKQDYKLHDPIRLLYTGGFNIRKGIHVLAGALELLKRNGARRVELHVYGAALPNARALMPDNVIFHGHVLQDRLKDALADSDMYVFPSLAEGCAQSAMEALSAGLPVITTENSGAPITSDRTGVLVPINDPEALAAAIVRLSEDDALRERIGREASAMMGAQYRWPHYGENVKALYEKLVAE